MIHFMRSTGERLDVTSVGRLAGRTELVGEAMSVRIV